jgi:putative acetyltransferase
MVTLKRTTCDDPHFQQLVQELNKDLWARYPETQHLYEGYNIITDIDTVVLACNEDMPVGCGCFKPYDGQTVEIKRMYVQPEVRGQGIAYKILHELEQWAAERGYRYSVLETAIRQPEAIHLYEKSGYTIIANYPPYDVDEKKDLSICYRKELQPAPKPQQA